MTNLLAGPLAAVTLIAMSFGALAQSADVYTKDLFGTWLLVSADAYGPNPKGALMFDSSGHFSAQFMKADLPKYASNKRVEGTPEEYKATVEGYIGYFGTYSLNGKDLRTNVTITGDELKYTQPTPSGGGAAAPIVWKRAK